MNEKEKMYKIRDNIDRIVLNIRRINVVLCNENVTKYGDLVEDFLITREPVLPYNSNSIINSASDFYNALRFFEWQICYTYKSCLGLNVINERDLNNEIKNIILNKGIRCDNITRNLIIISGNIANTRQYMTCSNKSYQEFADSIIEDLDSLCMKPVANILLLLNQILIN